MDNSSFFDRPLEGAQFFSVISSIMILGEVLHDTKLTIGDEHQPIDIINSLCEFLAKNSANEDEILDLGHRFLKDTDFYGSRKNETLHIEFVNSMFDTIIANTAFSKFGNTFGYLSSIVNSTNNLQLSSFKETITRNLRRQQFFNDNGNFSTLANWTITRITERIIFPLFPQPKKSMKIIDLKYIYAQAGWMLLRKQNRSYNFHILIKLAQKVEQEVCQGKIHPSALQIFQLPALLYYTHQKDNGIKRRNLKAVMSSTNFWYKVYNRFFNDFNITMDKMYVLLKQNSAFHFQNAFSKYQTRSAFANTTLRKNCPDENDFEAEIINYKYNPEEYYCKTTNRLQPNINEMFRKQNENIARKYYFYEMDLIYKTCDDLKKFINQINVTVKPVHVFWKYGGFRGAILTNRPTLNDSIDLFQVSDGEKRIIYALVRHKSGMKILSDHETGSFLDDIGLNSRAQLGIPFMAEDIKSATKNDDFNKFAIYIAKLREKMLFAKLQSIGYEATTGESVKSFFLHLIPFYSCAESIRSDTTSKAVMACIFDSLIAIPVLGAITSVSSKVSLAAIRAGFLGLKFGVQAFTLRESIKTVIRTSLSVMAMEMSVSMSRIITKELFWMFNVAILRALDPGIELLSMLTKSGIKGLMNIIKSIKIPQRNLNVVTSVKIGNYKGYDVHVQSITGHDGFGIKTFIFQDKIVELRRVRGYANEMPVVMVKSRKKRIYQIIDVETGKLKERELEEVNGVLETASKPLAVRLKIIQTEGLGGKGAIKKNSFRIHLKNNNQENINTASKYVEGTKDREIITNALKQYVLDDIDKKQIVSYWLEHKTFPKWSKDYELKDVKLYENLRYSPLLEELELDQQEVVKKIKDVYGSNYLRESINIDPDLMFHYYEAHSLNDKITFSDLFALANFINSGYKKLHLDDLETWNMKLALYKIAVRQYDDVRFSKTVESTLYTADMKISDELSWLQDDNTVDIEKFTVLTDQLDELMTVLVDANGQNFHSKSATVVHKIKLDHQCLAVHTQEYFPIEANKIILLPGIKLRVINWVNVEVKGQSAFVINWENVPFDKSKWLADTTNKIKILQDYERSVTDFDVDLLLQ